MDNNRAVSLLKGGEEFNYEVMEGELTCPVCLELYADPLMLSCSHNLCKRCLQDIFDSKCEKLADADSVEIELDCPSCRKSTLLTRDQISDLPKNLSLENVVIRYTEERSKSLRKSLSLDSPTTISDTRFSPTAFDLAELPEFPSELDATTTLCDLCDGKPRVVAAATWFCVQCQVSYCHACLSKYHPNKGPLSRHKLTKCHSTVSEPEVFCPDHEKEKASMYCDPCRVYACHLCVCDGEGKHTGHKMMVPQTAGLKVKESIQETKSSSDILLSRLAEQRGKLQTHMDDIQSLHTHSLARLDQSYARLVADISLALSSEKSRITNALSAAHNNEIARVKGCLRENEKRGGSLETITSECERLLEEESTSKMLSDAATLQPLRQTLTEEGALTESLTSRFEATVKNKATRHKLQTSSQDFNDGALRILQLFTERDYTPILPVIKTPSSVARADLSPRSPVQNRCLQTWGFSSSTFTGDELEGSATWTVTVERNHGGPVETGCLFGVGVSSGPLNIKDVVGVTAGTHGLLCRDGQVCFHDGGGKEDSVVALDGLPLSVTLSVNTRDPVYTTLTYKLEAAPGGGGETHSLPLEGRRLLTDARLKTAIFPVFTVSQRVKLIFPTYV